VALREIAYPAGLTGQQPARQVYPAGNSDPQQRVGSRSRLQTVRRAGVQPCPWRSWTGSSRASPVLTGAEANQSIVKIRFQRRPRSAPAKPAGKPAASPAAARQVFSAMRPGKDQYADLRVAPYASARPLLFAWKRVAWRRCLSPCPGSRTSHGDKQRRHATPSTINSARSSRSPRERRLSPSGRH